MPNKPMLSTDQLITHLENKGIKFNIITQDQAKEYLTKHNNFFKFYSYRKNYYKSEVGSNIGQYTGLEFAYLTELSRIDVEIRYILLKMCLDIEHFLKIHLISFVETLLPNGEEDGYKIVRDFVNSQEKFNDLIERKIANTRNPYCGELIAKYQSDMPIWALVEIITFGELLSLVDFCRTERSMPLSVDKICLDRVRQIRNATAHNNCIINDLMPHEGNNVPPYINIFLKNAGVSQNTRNRRLTNRRVNQIVHLFYVYNKLVIKGNTREQRINELKELFNNRISQNKEFFKNNSLLTSTYKMFLKIISNL